MTLRPLSSVVFLSCFLPSAAAQSPSRLTIEWSDPPNGYVDPSQDLDKGRALAGIRRILVTFSEPIHLHRADVSIEAAADATPTLRKLVRVDNFGRTWLLDLASPVEPGDTLTIVFLGELVLTYTWLPCDVTQDGQVSDDDLAALESAIINETEDLHYDIDDDGHVTVDDLTRLYDLMDGIGATQVWYGRTANGIGWICCEYQGNCVVEWAECVLGVEVACPCPGLGG